MIKFVGLHAHDGFSVADGLGYPSDHFDFAQKNGMEALAITNHGQCNSYGYMAEYGSKLKKNGNPFKIIYGMEAYLIPSIKDWENLRKQKKENNEEITTFIENEVESKGKHYDPIKRRHHLVLIAKNYEGLKNIFRLVTRSHREGFYRFPRIDFQMLKDHNEGLIVSSACLAGLPSWSILKDLEEPEEKILSNLENEISPIMEIFGKDRFFLELQYNKLPEQFEVNKYLIKLSQKTGFKNLVTVDSHYSDPNLWKEREIYRILGRQKFGYTNLSLDDLPQSIEELKCELYPKNGDQIFETYKNLYPEDTSAQNDYIKECIERSHEIAEEIEYLGPDGSYKLPKYKGVHKNEFVELKNLCMESLVRNGLSNNPEYVSRLAKELKVIKNKNFSAYFTVLYRAMKAIGKHLVLGPARGSGAGSLVCYLLEITTLDPIKNDLLFERFLSEAREEPPDIDCLHSETLVLTEKGLIQIKEIKPGDYVVDKNGEKFAVLLQQTRKPKFEEKIYEVFIDTNGVYGCIVASEKHKFILNNNEVKLCKDLLSGDILLSNNLHTKILFLEEMEDVKGIDLVDISVENSHMFQIVPFDTLSVIENNSEYICRCQYLSVDSDMQEILKNGVFFKVDSPDRK